MRKHAKIHSTHIEATVIQLVILVKNPNVFYLLRVSAYFEESPCKNHHVALIFLIISNYGWKAKNLSLHKKFIFTILHFPSVDVKFVDQIYI